MKEVQLCSCLCLPILLGNESGSPGSLSSGGDEGCLSGWGSRLKINNKKTIISCSFSLIVINLSSLSKLAISSGLTSMTTPQIAFRKSPSGWGYQLNLVSFKRKLCNY